MTSLDPSGFIFRPHAPIEIFGFHPDDPRVSIQRINRLCPFTNSECTKKLYRTDQPPSGSCSVSHNGSNVIICPNRFLEDNKKIIWNILNRFLGNGKIALISEATLPGNFGRVDFVGVKIGTNNEILDFISIETHANQTTSTGGLTDAIQEHEIKGVLSKNRYNFGLNTYHQIKTFFTQCLNKSQLFQKWDKKFIWILDSSVFDNWKSRFNITFNSSPQSSNIHFFSYGLEFNQKLKKYNLLLKEDVAVNRSNLLDAYMRSNDDLPDIHEFIRNISKKLD